MSRPRPRVEGKGNPAVTAKGAKSQAPKEARVVPKELTEGSEEAKKRLEASYRARAAFGMLKSKSQEAAGLTDYHTRGDLSCGTHDDDGE